MDKLSTGAILTELRKRNADPENKRLHLAAFLLEEPHHVIPQKEQFLADWVTAALIGSAKATLKLDPHKEDMTQKLFYKEIYWKFLLSVIEASTHLDLPFELSVPMHRVLLVSLIRPNETMVKTVSKILNLLYTSKSGFFNPPSHDFYASLISPLLKTLNSEPNEASEHVQIMKMNIDYFLSLMLLSSKLGGDEAVSVFSHVMTDLQSWLRLGWLACKKNSYQCLHSAITNLFKNAIFDHRIVEFLNFLSVVPEVNLGKAKSRPTNLTSPRAKKLIKNNNSEAVPAADRSVVASQFINQLALLAEQPDVQNDLEIGLPIFLEALILAGQAYLPEVLPEKYTKQFHHEKMVHTQEDLTVAYFNFYQFGFSLLKHTESGNLDLLRTSWGTINNLLALLCTHKIRIDMVPKLNTERTFGTIVNTIIYMINSRFPETPTAGCTWLAEQSMFGSLASILTINHSLISERIPDFLLLLTKMELHWKNKAVGATIFDEPGILTFLGGLVDLYSSLRQIDGFVIVFLDFAKQAQAKEKLSFKLPLATGFWIKFREAVARLPAGQIKPIWHTFITRFEQFVPLCAKGMASGEWENRVFVDGPFTNLVCFFIHFLDSIQINETNVFLVLQNIDETNRTMASLFGPLFDKLKADARFKCPQNFILDIFTLFDSVYSLNRYCTKTFTDPRGKPVKKESIVKKEIESDMEIDQDGTIEPFFAPIRQKISLLDLWNKFKDPEKPLFKKKPRMAFLLRKFFSVSN